MSEPICIFPRPIPEAKFRIKETDEIRWTNSNFSGITTHDRKLVPAFKLQKLVSFFGINLFWKTFFWSEIQNECEDFLRATLTQKPKLPKKKISKIIHFDAQGKKIP